MLEEWKVVIISVDQEYKLTKEWYDYKTRTGTVYKKQKMLIDIGKAKDNYNKDKRPKYFNYNKYKHMAKEY